MKHIWQHTLSQMVPRQDAVLSLVLLVERPQDLCFWCEETATALLGTEHQHAPNVLASTIIVNLWMHSAGL